MAKIKGAGVRLGKSVPGKSFPGAGKTTPFAGKIGGTGNKTTPKNYGKGK